MNYLKLVLISLVFTQTVVAQEYTKYKKYNWLAKSATQKITPEQEKEDAWLIDGSQHDHDTAVESDWQHESESTSSKEN